MRDRLTPLRIALIVAGLLLVVILIGALGGGGSPAPAERPESSTADRGPNGLTSLREVLATVGHDVETLNETPSRAELDPDSTVILLDPGTIDDEETDALRSFVAEGGRLVFGGDASLGSFEKLAGSGVDRDVGGPAEAFPVAVAPETIGVEAVALDGLGSFGDAGAALPVLAGPADEAVIAVASVGSGRMALLADASPLQNTLIGELDNAQLALDLAGDRDRPVVFAERVRLSETEGLAALPGRWRLAFAGLILAGLLLIASRVRRVGPPERSDRELPPPRRRYVDALAAALVRTRDPAAADAVRIAARRRLLARSGASPDATDDEIARLGRSAGLEESEWRALAGPAASQEEMMAAGRALAKLKEVRA